MGAMSKTPRQDKKSPEAQRLIKLREALDFEESAEFAREMGYTPTRWNNFENGQRLTRDVALRLVQKIPGLTTDWLFLGKTDGLPWELLAKLGELPRPRRDRDPDRPPAKPRR